MALADGLTTIRTLTESMMESFREEQLFCIRALLQQDKEYPFSYIASDVLVTALIGNNMRIFPIDHRDLD